MNETNPKIYCRECGSKLKEFAMNLYDEYTGYQLIGTTCPNLKCERGCAYAGHDFGFFKSRCKRCGYVICDIY